MNNLKKMQFSIEKINRYHLRAAYQIMIYLLGIMTLVVLAGVLFRYVLEDPLSWSEELSKFLMIWLTMLGSPIALQLGAHVGIDVLRNALKGQHFFLLLFVGDLIVLSILGICIKEGIGMTLVARQQTAVSLDLSLGWIYMAMPLGSLMMFLVALQQLINALRGVVDPRSVKIERDVTATLEYRDFLM